jgi:hypothetical protein
MTHNRTHPMMTNTLIIVDMPTASKMAHFWKIFLIRSEVT